MIRKETPARKQEMVFVFFNPTLAATPAKGISMKMVAILLMEEENMENTSLPPSITI